MSARQKARECFILCFTPQTSIKTRTAPAEVRSLAASPTPPENSGTPVLNQGLVLSQVLTSRKLDAKQSSDAVDTSVLNICGKLLIPLSLFYCEIFVKISLFNVC